MSTSIPVMVPIRVADLTSGPMRDLEAKITATIKRMGMQKLVVQADTSQLDRLSAKLAETGRKLRETGREQLKLLGEQLQATQRRTMSLYAEGAALAAQGYAYYAMLQPAVQFEQSMAKVGTVARANAEELKQLSKLARQLGRDTVWSASEAADGMQFLSMAGFSVNQVLEATPGMLDLASAGALDLGAAADIASNILTGFGLEAGEMGRVADVLTNALTSANVDVQMLGQTMKYVAPGAAALGVELEQVAAMAGQLGDAGLQSTQAGTQLRAILTRLAAPTTRAKKVFEELGVATSDASGNLRALPDILADMDHAMKDYGTATRQEMISHVFGMQAAAGATILLERAGAGALQEYTEHLREVGSAARVATEINNTTAGSAKELSSRMEALSITVGTMLLPMVVEMIDAVVPLIDRLVEWAEANPELIKTIGWVAAGLFGFRVASLAVRLAVQPLIAAFWLFNGALAAGAWAIGAKATALAYLTKSMAVAKTSATSLGYALLYTPILPIVAAIAGAAYLIYRNWGTVGPWFRRLIGDIGDVFIGFAQFVSGIVTGDLALSVEGIKRMWGGLNAYFQTLWDGIVGIFRWAWDTVIKPITDALGITEPIVAAWQALQAGLDVVLSALSAAFSAFWGVISPVIDGLKWVRDKGAEALNSVTGGNKGPISSGPYTGGATMPVVPTVPGTAPAGSNNAGITVTPTPRYAQGGTFTPGLMLVGERGPELRYESRAGYIAHNNALRRMADLSARIRAGGVSQPAVPARFAETADGGAMPLPRAGQGGSVSYAPHYNIEISASGLSETQLRAAIRAELAVAERRARADLRGLLHD